MKQPCANGGDEQSGQPRGDWGASHFCNKYKYSRQLKIKYRIIEKYKKQLINTKMTPEEQNIIDKNLAEVAAILYKYTSAEELNDFEQVELSVRKQLWEKVAPLIGNFFLTQQEGRKLDE
jgi:hypothetical protein